MRLVFTIISATTSVSFGTFHPFAHTVTTTEKPIHIHSATLLILVEF